jgi:hypothetical protein
MSNKWKSSKENELKCRYEETESQVIWKKLVRQTRN